MVQRPLAATDQVAVVPVVEAHHHPPAGDPDEVAHPVVTLFARAAALPPPACRRPDPGAGHLLSPSSRTTWRLDFRGGRDFCPLWRNLAWACGGGRALVSISESFFGFSESLELGGESYSGVRGSSAGGSAAFAWRLLLRVVGSLLGHRGGTGPPSSRP